MNQKQTISFQLDKTLVERLKQEADSQFLSTSALLRLILLKHFENSEKRL
jgi:hypothetical protein